MVGFLELLIFICIVTVQEFDEVCFSQLFITIPKFLTQAAYEEKKVYQAHRFGGSRA